MALDAGPPAPFLGTERRENGFRQNNGERGLDSGQVCFITLTFHWCCCCQALFSLRARLEDLTSKEGVLEKKGGGTSLFGSKGFKRRYVTVEEGKLSYYTVRAASLGLFAANATKQPRCGRQSFLYSV